MEDVIEARLSSGEYVTVSIRYSVEGKHRPSTWTWNGGSQEEWPEIEIEKIVNLDNNSELSETEIIFNRPAWEEKILYRWLADQEGE